VSETRRRPLPMLCCLPSFRTSSAVSQASIVLKLFFPLSDLSTTPHIAIIAAYYTGTSLYPEAKTYRFLADILYDGALILDALSPSLNSVYIPFYVPWLFPGSIPGLRVVALCLSASLRALCAVAATGSKSALTLHFATPETGIGDLGELSAKDASKETVLSLLGMLVRFHKFLPRPMEADTIDGSISWGAF
jgi:hypothetical protein